MQAVDRRRFGDGRQVDAAVPGQQLGPVALELPQLAGVQLDAEGAGVLLEAQEGG